jgi:CDP-diacylglycerol--glycerol-3-phosphate 3-phosphatidyltransferase
MTGVPASAAGGSSGAQGARNTAAAADGVASEVSGSAPAPGSDATTDAKPARGRCSGSSWCPASWR